MVAEQYPDAIVEIWAQDEARFGLIPSTRRIWARRGHRPLASSRRRYEWGYLYGFVHPRSGRTEWVLGSTVNVDAMSKVLADFAVQVGAGPKKRVIVVWDGAGWHTSPKLRVPEGIHVVQLPAYSPELQLGQRQLRRRAHRPRPRRPLLGDCARLPEGARAKPAR